MAKMLALLAYEPLCFTLLLLSSDFLLCQLFLRSGRSPAGGSSDRLRWETHRECRCPVDLGSHLTTCEQPSTALHADRRLAGKIQPGGHCAGCLSGDVVYRREGHERFAEGRRSFNGELRHEAGAAGRWSNRKCIWSPKSPEASSADAVTSPGVMEATTASAAACFECCSSLLRML
jgi:hypothetical protein